MSSPVSAGWFHVKLPPCRNLVLIKVMPNCNPTWVCLTNKGHPLAQGCMCVMKSHNNGSNLPPQPDTLPPWNHIQNERLLVWAMSFASFNKFWTSTKPPIPHTFICSLNSSFSINKGGGCLMLLTNPKLGTLFRWKKILCVGRSMKLLGILEGLDNMTPWDKLDFISYS